MYLVAGGLTVCWSVAIYFLLPPDPIRAKGFTERERYIAVARMRSNNSGVRNTHFKKAHVIEALTDVKFYMVFCIAFLMFIANGPVSSFIPIIIKSFGFSQLTSLLLIMPAGFMSGTTELLIPFLASKTNKQAHLAYCGLRMRHNSCQSPVMVRPHLGPASGSPPLRLLHPAIVRWRLRSLDGPADRQHGRLHETQLHQLRHLHGVLPW